MAHLTRVVCATLVVFTLAGCGAEESKERYLNRGIALYEAGDLVKAKLEFRNALQIDDKDAAAWVMLGRVEEDEANWSQAFGAYSKAIELDPGNAQARVKRGLLLLAANQIDDAVVEAEAVLSANPRDPEALVLRGAIENRRDNPDQAIADVQEALAMVPDHREALVLLGQIRLSQGDTAGAIAATQEAIAAYPKDTDLLLMLGGIYENVGETGAATDVLRKIVDLEPTDVAHRHLLAGFLAQQGQDEEALDVYRNAIAVDPEDTEAKLALVRFIADRRSLAEAAQELERLISEAPDDSKLQFALAEVQSISGDLAGARRTYEHVIDRADVSPAGLEARWRLAMLSISEDKPDEAEALASAVLSNDAGNEQALLIRGAVALERGDANQAISDARTVMRNNPSSLDALRLLAQGHLRKEEFALAQDALANAIKIAPDRPGTYLELARVRVASGDLDGALLTLEELLKQVPDSEDARNAIAQIQLGQQDWSALEASSERILKSSPDHPLGYYLQGLLLQRQGELDGAIKAFQASLDRAPGTVEPLLAMTKAYAAQGQFDKAEESVRQLLADSPNNITASILLAEIMEADARADEASSIYEDTIRFHPEAAAGYLGLAGLQERRGDDAGAIATLRKGIDAAARNDFMLFNLAILLQKASRDQEAVALYDEILARNPNADIVANNLAVLLIEDPNASQEQLNRALELTKRFEGSNQAALLDTLGWTQYRLERYEQAAATLDRAMMAGEPFPELQYHLGMVYRALGRNREAAELLRSASAAEVPFQGIEEAKAALESLEADLGGS
jgi:tetratricopeptide (TPR) repeat protein